MLQMNTEHIIESPTANFKQGQYEDGADGQFEDAPEEFGAVFANPDVKNHHNVANALIRANPTDGIEEIIAHEARLSKNNDALENSMCGTSDHQPLSPRKDNKAKRIHQDETFAKNDHSSGGFYDSEIREQDVLFGRGSRTNSHDGNIFFRSLVSSARLRYAATERRYKSSIAIMIVFDVKRRNGRFLKKDEKTGRWVEVCDKKARLKTSQALREGLAHKTRQALQLSNENAQSPG
mmetsp:Transcript_885/g.1203  ORF Transcript_885/g.1203 Transcript_885/m.1203 type:complete len:236 (-) Transcript_885:39-746(-)